VSLCEDCGLCCDGTFFAHVAVTPEEIAPLGGRVTISSDWSLMLQPCSALEGCRCSVYSDRPRICRAYRCLVLHSVEAGRITEEEGRASLDEVFAVRKQLAEAVGEADHRQAVQLARTLVGEDRASEEVTALLRELHKRVLLLQLPLPAAKR
jgi:polyhydroxyalkanoate synthesis regulator phasin